MKGRQADAARLRHLEGASRPREGRGVELLVYDA